MEIEVMEYRNGAYVRTWRSLRACAIAYGVGYEIIKCLIATGNALYWEDAVSITFDIPASSPYRYEMAYVNPGDARKHAKLILEGCNAQH